MPKAAGYKIDDLSDVSDDAKRLLKEGGLENLYEIVTHGWEGLLESVPELRNDDLEAITQSCYKLGTAAFYEHACDLRVEFFTRKRSRHSLFMGTPEVQLQFVRLSGVNSLGDLHSLRRGTIKKACKELGLNAHLVERQLDNLLDLYEIDIVMGDIHRD